MATVQTPNIGPNGLLLDISCITKLLHNSVDCFEGRSEQGRWPTSNIVLLSLVNIQLSTDLTNKQHEAKINSFFPVQGARDLRVADITGSSDPFAELSIVDVKGREKGPTHKTKIVKRTVNPQWYACLHVYSSSLSLSHTHTHQQEGIVWVYCDWKRPARELS